ncbi:MAG: alpha/beta hydrolase [Patescibacteria group bacterium]
MNKRSKVQIFYIHGGDTFRNQNDFRHYLNTRPIDIHKKVGWNGPYLDKMLGKKFHIIRPRMPLQDNAKYSEWKMHFERHFPYLKNNLILLGSSLGGMFLAKYLSEKKFPKNILSTYLVCPPFDDTLPSDHLAGGFKLKSDLSLIQKNSKKLTLLFSKNDDIVPVAQAKKYAAKLPHANVFIYKHVKGHFRIAKFPEIIRMIKRDVHQGLKSK